MLSPLAAPDESQCPVTEWRTLGAMSAGVQAHPGLWLPASPAELVEVAIDGDGSTFGRRGHERPMSATARALSAAALEGPDGQRALLAFTDVERARRYAVSRGWDSRVSLPSHTASWLPVLRRLVVEGWAGLVVDRPGPSPMFVSKVLAERVCAVLQRDRWARLPEWYVLTSNGTIAIERAASGQFRAWAFDSMEHAQRAIDGFLNRDAGVSIASFLTIPLVRDLVEAGVGCVHVNAGLHDEHRYSLEDLRAIAAPTAESLDNVVPVDQLSDPVFAAWAEGEWAHLRDGMMALSGERAGGQEMGALQPEAQIPSAMDTGSRRPASPEVRRAQIPRLERPDDDVRRQLAKFARRFETPYLPQWQLTEELAFGFDLSVVRPENALWPETDDEHVLAFFETSRAESVAASGRGLTVERLRGIEVLRWAWARSERTAVALMDLPQGPVRLPVGWALGALCPLAYDVGDIAKVPLIGLPRISTVLGARGLRPEVLRVVSTHWRQLLGVRREEAALTLDVDGASYLAVCTDAEEFFRLAARHAAPGVRPEPYTSAPFDRWVRGGAQWQGVVINPEATAPVVLDMTDLVVLRAWAALGRTPTLDEIVVAVGGLQAEGCLDQPAVGRVVADLPGLVSVGSPDGLAAVDGAVMAFSSITRATEYFAQLSRGGAGAGGELSCPGGTAPRLVPSGWRRSLIDTLPAAVSTVVLNPVPGGRPQVTLDATGLDAARVRLAEVFRPRVEPFDDEAVCTWFSE